MGRAAGGLCAAGVRRIKVSPDSLQQAICHGIANKPRGHDFRLDGEPVILRRMNMTGG